MADGNTNWWDLGYGSYDLSGGTGGYGNWWAGGGGGSYEAYDEPPDIGPTPPSFEPPPEWTGPPVEDPYLPFPDWGTPPDIGSGPISFDPPEWAGGNPDPGWSNPIVTVPPWAQDPGYETPPGYTEPEGPPDIGSTPPSYNPPEWAGGEPGVGVVNPAPPGQSVEVPGVGTVHTPDEGVPTFPVEVVEQPPEPVLWDPPSPPNFPVWVVDRRLPRKPLPDESWWPSIEPPTDVPETPSEPSDKRGKAKRPGDEGIIPNFPEWVYRPKPLPDPPSEPVGGLPKPPAEPDLDIPVPKPPITIPPSVPIIGGSPDGGGGGFKLPDFNFNMGDSKATIPGAFANIGGGKPYESAFALPDPNDPNAIPTLAQIFAAFGGR